MLDDNVVAADVFGGAYVGGCYVDGVVVVVVAGRGGGAVGDGSYGIGAGDGGGGCVTGVCVVVGCADCVDSVVVCVGVVAGGVCGIVTGVVGVLRVSAGVSDCVMMSRVYMMWWRVVMSHSLLLVPVLMAGWRYQRQRQR